MELLIWIRSSDSKPFSIEGHFNGKIHFSVSAMSYIRMSCRVLIMLGKCYLQDTVIFLCLSSESLWYKYKQDMKLRLILQQFDGSSIYVMT